MTYPLPTDTRHVTIESRQYRLWNADLGEGIRRQAILIGALIFIPWIVLMAVIGVAFFKGFALYVGPPALVTTLALRVDDGGRPTWAKWLDRVRWWVRKRRIVVEKPGGGVGVSAPFIARAQWVVLDLDELAPKIDRKARQRR